MKSITSNLALWFLIIGVGGFALSFGFGGYDFTVYVMAALIFGASVIVAGTWASTAYVALRSGLREGEALLGFAVCGLALYGVYTRAWAVTRVVLDDPPWMATSPIGLFAGVLLLICLVAIILAPGTKSGVVPKRNILYWAISAGVAGIFIGMLIGFAVAKQIPLVNISADAAARHKVTHADRN